LSRKTFRLFEYIGLKRGYRAEDRTEEVLKEMDLDYKRSARGSEEDKKGIDFQVWIGRQHLLIDVKSSQKGAEEVMKHNRENKTFVFPLVVRPRESKNTIKQKIRFLISKHREFITDIQQNGRKEVENKWTDPRMWQQEA